MDNETTPILVAAGKGHVEVLSALLDAGANLGKVDGHDERVGRFATPLMASATHGQVEAVRHLLDAGADVDHARRDGATALFLAAVEGHLEVVRALLDAGASVNRARVDGVTPLSMAAKHGHLDIVRALQAAEARQVRISGWMFLKICCTIIVIVYVLLPWRRRRVAHCEHVRQKNAELLERQAEERERAVLER